jgi:hypothetical protein
VAKFQWQLLASATALLVIDAPSLSSLIVIGVSSWDKFYGVMLDVVQECLLFYSGIKKLH